MENKFMRVEEVAEVLEVSTSFAYPPYQRKKRKNERYRHRQRTGA